MLGSRLLGLTLGLTTAISKSLTRITTDVSKTDCAGWLPGTTHFRYTFMLGCKELTGQSGYVTDFAQSFPICLRSLQALRLSTESTVVFTQSVLNFSRAAFRAAAFQTRLDRGRPTAITWIS